MSNGVDFRKLALDLRAQLTAAQSELAALREELSEKNGQLEQISRNWQRSIDRENDYYAKLTATEQRNAELVELLRELDNNWNSHDGRERFSLAMRKVEAALNPTESGASE